MGKGDTTTHTNSKYESESHAKQYTTPFTSDVMKKRYNDFFGDTKKYYNNTLKSTNNLSKMLDSKLKQGSIGDTSYFQSAWDKANGIDQSNLIKMNSADLNPYNDEVTRNYIDASNKAAYLANGQNINQMMGNMISTGMANGSGHQTAAAKVGAQLAANINAQNQATYMARQNQLEQNALAANNQLGNFYNTLANIGIDYARLNQQDLNTLLTAYNQVYDAQNNAINTYGNAVYMGSDPSHTSDATAKGTQESTQKSHRESDPFSDVILPLAGATASAFTGFGKGK